MYKRCTYNQTAQTNGLLTRYSKICTIDVPDRKSKYGQEHTHKEEALRQNREHKHPLST